jgi:hypothetical protein
MPVLECEAGHAEHDTITLDTDIGKFEVYNWDTYKDQPGVYCPGQDDVSRTIIETKGWARDETKIISALLRKGPKKTGLVLDFGAHIGWYSIMAAKMGYDVGAFEAVWEHQVLLDHNIENADVREKVIVQSGWIDKDNCKTIKLQKPYKEVYFCKIDLEGNEQYAIKMIEDLLKQKKIRYLFMEVSPVFNKSYPNLVNKIIRYGYDAYKDGKKFDNIWNFDQTDILFKVKK